MLNTYCNTSSGQTKRWHAGKYIALFWFITFLHHTHVVINCLEKLLNFAHFPISVKAASRGAKNEISKWFWQQKQVTRRTQFHKTDQMPQSDSAQRMTNNEDLKMTAGQQHLSGQRRWAFVGWTVIGAVELGVESPLFDTERTPGLAFIFAGPKMIEIVLFKCKVKVTNIVLFYCTV